jgi:hypothetical protein
MISRRLMECVGCTCGWRSSCSLGTAPVLCSTLMVCILWYDKLSMLRSFCAPLYSCKPPARGVLWKCRTPGCLLGPQVTIANRLSQHHVLFPDQPTGKSTHLQPNMSDFQLFSFSYFINCCCQHGPLEDLPAWHACTSTPCLQMGCTSTPDTESLIQTASTRWPV